MGRVNVQEVARTEHEVRRHVDMLAGLIGERNVYRYGALEAAARYIEDTFREHRRGNRRGAPAGADLDPGRAL